jgi:hypothetical protein
VAVTKAVAKFSWTVLFILLRATGRKLWNMTVGVLWPWLKAKWQRRPRLSNLLRRLLPDWKRVVGFTVQTSFAGVFLWVCYGILSSWQNIPGSVGNSPSATDKPPTLLSPPKPVVTTLEARNPHDKAVLAFHGKHQTFTSLEEARTALTDALDLPPPRDDKAIDAAVGLAVAHVNAMQPFKTEFPLHPDVSERLLAILVPTDLPLLSKAITFPKPWLGRELSGTLTGGNGSFSLTLERIPNAIGPCGAGTLSIQRMSFSHTEPLIVCQFGQRFTSHPKGSIKP